MINNRHILITGGSTGIGVALVERLSKNHQILTTARQITPELQKLIDNNGNIHFVPVDLSDVENAPNLLLQKLSDLQWAKLDNLILNAGAGYVSAPQDESASSIRDTIAINLTANIALAHIFFKLLEASKGQLTFIGSTAHRGANQFASYAASKAGLNGLARNLKEEWRGKVKVQILHPGPTQTQMHAKAGMQLGAIHKWFIPAKSMAVMIDKSIAKGNPKQQLSFLQYWSGRTYRGRAL